MPTTQEPAVPLKLYPGSPPLRHTFASTVQSLMMLVALVLSLPFHLLFHYVFFRRRSPLRIQGRHPVAAVLNHVVKYLFGAFPLPFGRLIYATQLSVGRDPWIERIETHEGVRGIWVQPPGTDRRCDDLVLFWIHGGAFDHDIIGSSIPFYKSLALELNNNTPQRQFSIFVLDYHLAPEMVYPSQLIELEAGYRYLTQTIGIDSKDICLGGDSAGGNLVMSFCLHLTKPNPLLPTPSIPLSKPGSVFLMSPWSSLLPLASRKSRTSYAHSTADFLMTPWVTIGAFHYLGLDPPFQAGPSWNPLKWFGILADKMPRLELEHDFDPLFNDPYINPGPEVVAKESFDWYAQALPSRGRTAIVWGGMEIFADDIAALCRALKMAGVGPTEIFHPYKCHDWPLFDYSFPFLSRTKAGGPSSRFDYGMKEMAKFLRGVSTVKKNGGSRK